MKLMKLFVLCSFLMVLSSCSDATKGAFSSLGKSRNVRCFSGGVEVYTGKTTGKIQNENNSDGYYFTDTKGTYVETNMDCLITVDP